MSELSIYQNILKTEITIETVDEVELVSLFSFSGELVQQENTKTFSIESLPQGVYSVNIKTNNGISHCRFIKE